MATELLYTCPLCARKNFTSRGLRRHRCPEMPMRRMTPTGPKVRPPLSLPYITKALKHPQQ